MQVNDERVARFERLYHAWAEAEKAVKIADQVVGDVVIPAIKELRYAGRKLSKGLHNYIVGNMEDEADRWIEDAINDCHRARHDATDAATAFIARRLEQVMDELGSAAVREHFPEYADLRGNLATVRRKVAAARHDHNGRHDIYEVLEEEELPQIMALYEKLLANEPSMKDDRFGRFLARQGITLGWLVALGVALYAAFR